jgi:hypothetical protein
MKKRALAVTFVLALASLSLASAPGEEGFVALFDGQSLAGWHASAQTWHSTASQHKSGGRWLVEDGAIVGSQDIPGNGGILISDEKLVDFEVVLEMKNDYGPDSGLFLRATEDGTAYQAMIDYHADGNLMGIYGEGALGARPSVHNFNLLTTPEQIAPVENAACPLPVLPSAWKYFWRHGQWNELRARITGGALPTIVTWINGVQIMQWTETEQRLAAPGGIGLQVHGGGDFTQQYVRYRNIRVKKL